MTYQLTGNSILFAINRADIVDITSGDIITVDGLAGVEYVWTNHDSDFLENNPDDDIYLEVERIGTNKHRATGISLKSPSPV